MRCIADVERDLQLQRRGGYCRTYRYIPANAFRRLAKEVGFFGNKLPPAVAEAPPPRTAPEQTMGRRRGAFGLRITWWRRVLGVHV